MDLDEDYIEYVGQSSLALLAISAAYFVSLDNLVTLLALLPVTVLYGYTTYISRDGFNTASMLSSVTIIFIPVSTFMGFIAVFIPVSNTLISLFASGTGFKNYSNATLMPMVFTGLILGSVAFGAAQTQPDIRQNIVNSMADVSEKQTSVIMEQTDLANVQEEAGTEIVTQTSENTVLLTRSYVLNETDFSEQQNSELDQAFTGARNKIPERLANRTAENAESVDMAEQAGNATRNLIDANLGVIILIASLFFYAVNPLISILTAVSALIFEKMADNL
ncbi:MAG: hypothetical protein ACI8Z7_000704 [Candidatus Nanohaloarchaea archaeon]|jgi:hypothetical protein